MEFFPDLIQLISYFIAENSQKIRTIDDLARHVHFSHVLEVKHRSHMLWFLSDFWLCQLRHALFICGIDMKARSKCQMVRNLSKLETFELQEVAEIMLSVCHSIRFLP